MRILLLIYLSLFAQGFPAKVSQIDDILSPNKRVIVASADASSEHSLVQCLAALETDAELHKELSKPWAATFAYFVTEVASPPSWFVVYKEVVQSIRVGESDCPTIEQIMSLDRLVALDTPDKPLIGLAATDIFDIALLVSTVSSLRVWFGGEFPKLFKEVETPCIFALDDLG